MAVKFRNSTRTSSSSGTDQRILACSDEAGGGAGGYETRQEWNISDVPFRVVLRLVVARIESQRSERVLRGSRGGAAHSASLSSRVASGDLRRAPATTVPARRINPRRRGGKRVPNRAGLTGE